MRTLRSDEEAFRSFVVDFSPTLFRAAFLLLRDRGAAEDVVQTTLLRTFRRWRRARPAPEAYSQRVLINVCRDHWRHQRRHPAPAHLDGIELADPAPDLPERIAQREALMHALGELSPQQREVVVLRFFLDLSVAETSRLLGIPEGTIKSSAHRGLATLRGLVQISTEEVHRAQ